MIAEVVQAVAAAGGRRVGGDALGDHGLPGARARAQMHHVGGQFDRSAVGVSGGVLDAISHGRCLACVAAVVAGGVWGR